MCCEGSLSDDKDDLLKCLCNLRQEINPDATDDDPVLPFNIVAFDPNLVGKMDENEWGFHYWHFERGSCRSWQNAEICTGKETNSLKKHTRTGENGGSLGPCRGGPAASQCANWSATDAREWSWDSWVHAEEWGIARGRCALAASKYFLVGGGETLQVYKKSFDFGGISILVWW